MNRLPHWVPPSPLIRSWRGRTYFNARAEARAHFGKSCERGGLVELVLGASGLVALETQVTTEIEPGARCVT